MKNYRLFLAVFLVMFASACNQVPGVSTNANPQKIDAPAGTLEHGGISGGGGGTLPAEPATAYEVNQVISEAKTTLRLLVNVYDDSSFPVFSSGLQAKLFNGSQTIKDMIETTDIEVHMTSPCFDSAQNAVDGSIFANRKNTICMSPFQIAPKIDHERMRTEVEALIMHELSHLLGATEDEAVEFQKQVKRDLSNQTEESTKNFLMWADAAASHAEWIIDEVAGVTFADPVYVDEARALMMQASEDERNVGKKLFNYDARQFTVGKKERDYLTFLDTRLYFASQYAYCHMHSQDAHLNCETYEKLLNNGESVTFVNYWVSQTLPADDVGTYGNELIHRIHSQAEFVAELKEMAQWIHQLDRRVVSIQNYQALSLITLPDSSLQTPWKKAEGAYTVNSHTCSSPNFFPDYTGIQIYSRNGLWFMKREFAGGYAELSLDNGGNGSQVTVGETGAELFRSETRGDLWSFERTNGYLIQAYRLDFTSNRVHLIIDQDEKNGYNTLTEVPSYVHNDCVYELTKTP